MARYTFAIALVCCVMFAAVIATADTDVPPSYHRDHHAHGSDSDISKHRAALNQYMQENNYADVSSMTLADWDKFRQQHNFSSSLLAPVVCPMKKHHGSFSDRFNAFLEANNISDRLTLENIHREEDGQRGNWSEARRRVFQQARQFIDEKNIAGQLGISAATEDSADSEQVYRAVFRRMRAHFGLPTMNHRRQHRDVPIGGNPAVFNAAHQQQQAEQKHSTGFDFEAYRRRHKEGEHVVPQQQEQQQAEQQHSTGFDFEAYHRRHKEGEHVVPQKQEGPVQQHSTGFDFEAYRRRHKLPEPHKGPVIAVDPVHPDHRDDAAAQ